MSGTVTPIRQRNAKKFARSIRDIPDTYLVCRDLGHAWDFHDDDVLYGADGRTPIEITRGVKCLRCKMLRVDHYDLPSFTRTRTRYAYPDRYLLARTVTKERPFSRTDARSEFYARRHHIGEPS